MLTAQERLSELDSLVKELNVNYQAMAKGNKAARTRFRNGLQSLKQLGKTMLIETPPASQLDKKSA